MKKLVKKSATIQFLILNLGDVAASTGIYQANSEYVQQTGLHLLSVELSVA
jgi:hypothetical protein